MSKFVEVLVTGLTVHGQVRKAGEFVQVPDGFAFQTKRKQVKRWGHPKFHEVTKTEFEAQGGKVLDIDDAPESDASEAPEKPEDASGGESDTTVDPFAALSGLDVQDTLSAVSGFAEDELASFIVHEKTGANRAGVLGPLGAE